MSPPNKTLLELQEETFNEFHAEFSPNAHMPHGFFEFIIQKLDRAFQAGQEAKKKELESFLYSQDYCTHLTTAINDFLTRPAESEV